MNLENYEELFNERFIKELHQMCGDANFIKTLNRMISEGKLLVTVDRLDDKESNACFHKIETVTVSRGKLKLILWADPTEIWDYTTLE